MEEFGLDSKLIDEIVCKVKSEGLFDQFRRECLADVDTKPAYQNLQHRVETCVCSFLDDQIWNSQMNKNHLREKLRKLITEKRFFETGIERIVDQVINPKLTTNFVPKIEDVAYKFLGLEKPTLSLKLKLETDSDVLIPIYELEQVSPESEKSQSNESKYATARMYPKYVNYNIHEEFGEKTDDLESPAFEPIAPNSENNLKTEPLKDADEDDDDNMDISDDDNIETNGFLIPNTDELKSNLSSSSISGLTSNESNNSYDSNVNDANKNSEQIGHLVTSENTNLSLVHECHEQITETYENCIAPEARIDFDSAQKLPLSENIISNTSDLIISNMNQDSILSQVSSTSRLSIVTNYNTGTQMADVYSENSHTTLDIGDCSSKHIGKLVCPYELNEEAQMQKFNDSSSSSNNLIIDTEISTSYLGKRDLITSFDIKREEIKFEGTERNFYDINISHETEEEQGKLYNENMTTKFEFNLNCSSSNVKETTSAGYSKDFSTVTSDIKEFPHDSVENEISRTFQDQEPQSERHRLYQRKSIQPIVDSHGKDSSKSSAECSKKWKNKIESSPSSSSPSPTNEINSSIEFVSNQTCPVHKLKRNNLKNDKFEKQKSQTVTQKSSANDDDHSTHKIKITSRQRSHSKDSNDGFTQSNYQSSYNQSKSNVISQPTSNNQKTTTHSTKEVEDKTTSCISDEKKYINFNSLRNQMKVISQRNKDEHQNCKLYTDRKKTNPSTQPVVIDQILSGNELDLKSFIGENRSDPVVSSIEQSLGREIKKPKVAANIFEAKRLVKIRKQIELNNQKKLEKATVLAKQYIRTKTSNICDDTQGIELEFICAEDNKCRSVAGPIISSPDNFYCNGKTRGDPIRNVKSTTITITNAEGSNSISKILQLNDTEEFDKLTFVGFETSEIESANTYHQTLLKFARNSFRKSSKKMVNNETEKSISTSDFDFCNKLSDKHDYFIENTQSSKPCNRKRKSEVNNDPKASSVKDNEVILANVFISKTDSSTRTDNQISGLEKQRQKTRYSNDDLFKPFKPRPSLGGVSRRRRDFNCSD